MRISTGYQYEVYANEIEASQQRMFQAQQQEITGLAINSPSDNPGGAQQLISVQALQNQLTQYSSNLTQAKNVLSMTDSSLGTAGTVMSSAYQVALQATSGTITPTVQQSLLNQISDLQQQLVSTGNAQGPNGEYLFAGQNTGTQPFSASAGTMTYSGDGNSISIEGGPTDSLTINVPGSPLFTNAYSALQTLKSDISSGNYSTISSTDIATLQSSQSAFSQAQGQIGATGDQVASLALANTQQSTNLTSDISSLQNVNTAQAVTNYTTAQTAYQAALASVSQSSNLSLANYITGQ